jgi:beta-glucosidase
VQIVVDGQTVLDTTIEPIGSDLGAALLAPPAESVTIDVVAGNPLELLFLHTPRQGGAGLQNALGFRFGLLPSDVDDDVLIAEAVTAARDADLVVVVVGSNKDLEAEGADRETLSLPGRQDDMVRALADANNGTVAIVNCGAPVLLPWADQVGAVLQGWFGGQEMGGAIGDMLTGVREPGGRLPTTWPANEADVPVLHIEPVDGAVEYAEGIHVGYRGWLRNAVAPAYAFGHGLGYTSWALSELMVPAALDPGAPDREITVTIGVRNEGPRRGKQVVQLYASRPDTSIDRPQAWLIGFGSVELDAGEQTSLNVSVPARAFAHFDGGWAWEPGEFTISAGTSLTCLILEGTLTVRGE